MKDKLGCVRPDLSEPPADARGTSTTSLREAIARVKTILAEAKEDKNKMKLYFGHIET